MSSLASPLVLKVGGSLFDRVLSLLEIIREVGRPVLIVPGGGKFADLVRRLNVSDTAGHWMAIAGMEQFGWYIASHGIPATVEVVRPAEPTVFLPYCSLRRIDPLPHSWNVTSDTIAAWVASELQIDLVLLKSVDGIYHHRGLVHRIDQPCITCNEVDPALIPFALEHSVRTWVINGRHDDRVRGVVQGEQVTGSLIDPRF